MEKQNIQPIEATLSDGSTVSIKGQSVDIPQPVQTRSKDSILGEIAMIDTQLNQIALLQKRKDYLNELLNLIS